MESENESHAKRFEDLISEENFTSALLLLRQRLRDPSAKVSACCGIGACFYKLRRPRSATRWLRKALLIDPKHRSSRFNLANALTDLERFDEAIYHYRVLTSKEPTNIAYLINYCHALVKAGMPEPARHVFRALDPLVSSNLQLSLELARLVANKKFNAEVKPFLTRLIRRYPQSDEAFYLLALCYRDEWKHEDAIILARQALTLRDDSPTYLYFLSETCLDVSFTEEALRCLERLLEMGSKSVDHLLSYRLAFPSIPRSSADLHTYWARALAGLRTMVLAPPQQRTSPYLISPHLFFLAYHWQNLRVPMSLYSDMLANLYGLNSRLSEASQSSDRAASAPPAERRSPLQHARPQGRIRIGFASEYFSEHSNSRAFEGLITHIDKSRFELVLIQGPQGPEDDTSRRLSAMADKAIKLRNIHGAYPDHQQIIDLDLDLLFYTDLGMNTQMNYLAMQRLAPIQMTGWGIPHTSGIRTIDYYLSSELAEPEDAQDHYVESLVRLPGLPCCYLSSKLELYEVPRDYYVLPPGAPVFGCLQSLYKLHPDFDAALEELALANPDAAFVFVESPRRSFTERFIERIRKTAPHFHEQLIFLALMNRYEFIALSNVIDVLLDPFYYCSGITFYESTFVGTPTVTLEGRFLRSRFVAAGYKLMGISNPPVAQSVEEYVAIATRLMQNPVERAQLREELRQKARQHLYDDLSYVRGFEEFCQQAVVRHGLRAATVPAGAIPDCA